MAYNTFKIIPDNCSHVYGLADKGTVFYIGITSHPLFRYRQHFTESLCCNYIKNMLINGRMPEFIIYGMYDYEMQAEAAEHSLIYHFASIGNRLCNSHQNTDKNRIISDIDKSIKVPRCKIGLSQKIVNEAIEKYKKFRLCQIID